MTYLIVILAQLCDLLTFVCVASVLPIDLEANPLARAAYGWNGLYGVVLLKVAGVSLILLGVSLSHGWIITTIVVVAVALGLLGAITNTLSLVLSA